MRLLFIFLFISGISYAQGKVVSRHPNGQKEWVYVYTGTGINEKLTTKYYYKKFSINYSCKIKFSSTTGYPIEKLVYKIDDNGKRYLHFKKTKLSNGEIEKINYNPNGTIESTENGHFISQNEY